MSLKPYRTDRNYDAFDKMYTDVLKKKFNDLPPTLKEEFQRFTHNLMDDVCIYSHNLFDANQQFYKKNKDMCDNAPYWKGFSDEAFNYRPWCG